MRIEKGAVQKVLFPVIASGAKQSRALIFKRLLRLLRYARNDIALAMTSLLTF
jgi:hypothetical protein